MRAPALPPSLQLCNRSGANARVRLHCGERQIWDAWVPATGTLTSPALAPERITLSASVTEHLTRVTHATTLRDAPGRGRYVASLRQDRGAPLFMLSAARADDVAGLWLTNTTAWAMNLRLAICASPYEMSAHLAPGASLMDAWAAPLSLDVIVDGRSVRLALAAGAGRWQIEESAEPPGFSVVALDSLDTPRSPT